MWAIDFCFDRTSDLRTLKALAVTDEFTKEALAIEVDRSIDAITPSGSSTASWPAPGGDRRSCAWTTTPS